MLTKKFPLDRTTLFNGRTETIALIYEQTMHHKGDFINDDGDIEYVDEKHIYEQVEYFNSITELKKRQKVLAKTTNRDYSNFTAIKTDC